MEKYRPSTNEIVIDYLEDTFTEEELDTLKKLVGEQNYTIYGHPHRPKHINGIEELFAHITVFLPPDLIKEILIGLSINGGYDCIKMFFVNFWKTVKAKKLAKIQGGKITEEVPPVVHARAGNMSFVIPIELEEEKFKYFVDKMFSSIDAQTIKETKYAFYENENIVFYTQDQIAEKAMREWQEKQRDK